MELINSFKRYLIGTVKRIVIKNVPLATANETMESRRAGDLYVSAMLKNDRFESYESYSESVIRKAGINDNTLIRKCLVDKRNIPHEYRDRVVIAQREKVIAEYEEQNDYYRMIHGLKGKNQESIMVPPSIYRSYGLTGDTPLALDTIPSSVVAFMESDGYLDTLIKRYPDHKYIPYLGERKVDIVTARQADDYQLLYTPRLDNGYRFYRDFIFYYEEARQYFLSCVFNYNFANRYSYYYGFIGFMILHMAIQRTLNGTFKVFADRDFYDLETIRVFLDAYSIPFIDIFTMNQQKLLAKNLNILLREKGDIQVLYNVLNLLGYDNFELLKFMLVKQHVMIQEDDESLPIPQFYYKTVVDENANQVLQLDKGSMYDYYFVGLPMDDMDPVIKDFTDINSHEYHEFVDSDPTWEQDDELSKALDNMEMNYVETKYAALNLAFKIQEINFELTYLSRLILDKKNQTSRIMIDVSLISALPVSLFDLWILLICLHCKRNSIEPDIIKTPSKTLAILGYNFKSDFEALKKDVLDHQDLYDDDTVKYIKDFQLGTISDVNHAYGDIKRLASILTSVMQRTDDPDVYHANEKLYNAILIMERSNEIYKTSTGNIASMYTEYLMDAMPHLYDFLNKIEGPDACVDYINYIATKMSTALDETKWLSYLNPVDINLINAILKILNAFKSFTIDIKDISVIYQFDDRYQNLMKMMDKAWRTRVNLKADEKPNWYSDAIHVFNAYVNATSKTDFKDGYRMSATVFRKDAEIMHDLMVSMHGTLKVDSPIKFEDALKRLEGAMTATDKNSMHDKFIMWYE